jgi:hypothetical protein
MKPCMALLFLAQRRLCCIESSLVFSDAECLEARISSYNTISFSSGVVEFDLARC